MRNNLLATNHKCAKQLIVHTQQLCTTYFPHSTAVQNKLMSTHHSCAKQLIVHTPQLCKAAYCPHTTAVQNNLLPTYHSCAKQIILHTPQLCKATYCPHTTAAQKKLLSTHHRNLFSTVIAVNKFVDPSFGLSFAQLLHSTRIHRKFRAHVVSPAIKLYAQARGHRCLSSRIPYIPWWDLWQIYHLVFNFTMPLYHLTLVI